MKFHFAVDRHRPNFRIIKKMLRLTDTGDIATVIHFHGATITDNYWIKSTDENLAKEYLNILFMDTLCFNMDRHTYNYGFLRDRQTGKIVCMAPNFDNNIALISRGYATEAKKSSNLLIELFFEFLTEKNINYNLPCISKEMVTEISKTSLSNENIDIHYVVDFIMDRYMRIENAMQILQLN